MIHSSFPCWESFSLELDGEIALELFNAQWLLVDCWPTRHTDCCWSVLPGKPALHRHLGYAAVVRISNTKESAVHEFSSTAVAKSCATDTCLSLFPVCSHSSWLERDCFAGTEISPDFFKRIFQPGVTQWSTVSCDAEARLAYGYHCW